MSQKTREKVQKKSARESAKKVRSLSAVFGACIDLRLFLRTQKSKGSGFSGIGKNPLRGFSLPQTNSSKTKEVLRRPAGRTPCR